MENLIQETIQPPVPVSPERPRIELDPLTGRVNLNISNTPQVDPPPFDLDGYFAEWTKTQSIETIAQKHEGFSKVLLESSRPFAGGYNTLSALNRGAASLYAHWDAVTDFIEISGAGKKEGLLDNLAKISEEKADYWKSRVDQVGISFLEEMVSEAVGKGVPGVIQFAIDVGSGFTFPYMAGAARAYKKGDNPFVGGMIEAAKTGTLAAVFRMMGPLKTYLKAPVMGTIFGFQEMEGAPEGEKTKAFAKGFGIGNLYAFTSNGGKLGINEIYENAKPLLEKAKAQFETGRNIVESEKGMVIFPDREMRETAYQNVFNRFASIENLDKRAEAFGARIKPGESPGKRAREYLGIQQKVQSVLQDSTYKIKPDGKIEITGEGLEPVIREYEKLSPEKDVKTRTKEFNDYFSSVRTIEDLQRPKDDWSLQEIVTPAQVQGAQLKLDGLRQKYGNLNHFEAIAGRLYEYQKRVLNMLVDSGNLSNEQFNNIISLNPHYVPFDRIIDGVETTSGGGPKSKKPFDETRSPVKRIKGSEKEIQDILGSIIKNTYRIMDVAERNIVARNIARLESFLPEDIEHIKTPMRPIRVSPGEIDTITMQFKQKATEIKENVKKTGGIVTSETQSSPMTKLEKIVTDALQYRGMSEGEANVYLHKIKESAKGKEGITTPTATETIEKTIEKIVKETVNVLEMPVESTIFRPSQFKPKGNVIEYYENGQRRYMDVSDNLYSSMSGLNEVSSDFLIKMLSYPTHTLRVGVTSTPEFMARNFIRDQFGAFIQSKTGVRPGVDTIGALADVIGKTDVYYDWLRSGGGHSTFVDLSRKNLEQLSKHIKGDESSWRYLNIINDAQQISQAVEQATRLGVYKAGIRNGLSPVEAAFQSREATVDFGVHGESRGIKTFSSITAFFNPAIQGTDKFIRVHREDIKGTATKAIASLTIPSVILWYINKDDPDYKELPRWQKDLFWMVKVGNAEDAIPWARIPKPFLFGQVYGSSVERFLDYVNTKDPKALKDFGKTLIDASTPAQGDPTGILLPTAVKPLIENETNWSFFMERPVVSPAKKDLFPYMQHGKYDTETAKMIGKKLNWSPAKIENFIRGISGGTGQYALEVTDLALGLVTGKDEKGKRPTEVSDIPLIKGFVTRPVEADPQSLRDFYENAKAIDTQYKSYRDSLKNLDLRESMEIQKKYPKLLLYPSVNSIKEGIAALNKQIDLIAESKSFSDADKRNTISKLERMRLKIAQTGNKLIEGKMNTAIKEEQDKQEWIKFIQETQQGGTK